MVMDNDKEYEKAVRKSFKLLKRAAALAMQHRDVEALIAISDRWILLSDRIGQNCQEELPIGFISQERDVRDNKAGNKRKS